MKKLPILNAIQTLRAGDIITNFTCKSCSDKKVLVLSRTNNGQFELSVRDDSVQIVRDPRGPFRWDSGLSTFIDKDRKAYNHIGQGSMVIEGGGQFEFGLYQQLPKVEDAPFIIGNKNLLGSNPDNILNLKMEALVNRMILGEEENLAAEMQLQILLAVGDSLTEQQMRRLIMLMTAYKHLGERSTSPFDDILEGLIAASDNETDHMFGAFGGLAESISAMMGRHAKQDGQSSSTRDPRHREGTPS